MKITQKTDGKKIIIALEGRMDTNTAPELETALRDHLDGIEELVIDMAALQYLSSAGLRVLLSAQKTMNRQGHMTVTNVNDTIMEIFEITGFADILTIV